MNSNELQDQLDADLAWRQQEISALYSIAQTNESNVLIKSLLLIIYSHWEGFIKNSFKLYLDFVSKKNINITDLTENYKAIYLRSISNKCIMSGKKLTLQNELEFIRLHSECANEQFSLGESIAGEKDSSLIDTNGNLKPDIFFNLCNIVGAPEKQSVRIRSRWIDDNLVKNRHAIGHGNKVLNEDAAEFDLELSDIREIKEIMLAIMMSYKDDIAEYSSKGFYLVENTEEKKDYDIESNTALGQIIKFG
jgi:hypothetical protein